MEASSSSKSPRIAPVWLRNGTSSRGVDSEWVRKLARECGLEVAAIAGPEPFDGLEVHLHERIERGHLGGFDWFTPERASISAAPGNLHAGVKSIVSVGLPYYQAMPELPDDGSLRGRIARYAWGGDYHFILKRRMAALLARIEDRAGRAIEARTLVDTARIVDRAVAGRTGLGWYGKNTCIIVPGYGSWVLLGELLLDFELEPDGPLDRNCGKCRACIDRCPTGAIVGPYELDSTRCISFQTIEQRGAIPLDLRPQFGNWVFGCDECQDICPYTGAAKEAFDRELVPRSLQNVAPDLGWLLKMTGDSFRATYRGTAVLRAKRRGLARNAAIALGNAVDDRAVPMLQSALWHHDEPLVRGHAAWGLGRYPGPTARHGLERALTGEPEMYVREEISQALDASAT
jgi:epoxyqueuosine reductase